MQGHWLALKGPYPSRVSYFLKKKDLFNNPVKLRRWKTGKKKDHLILPLFSSKGVVWKG